MEVQGTWINANWIWEANSREVFITTFNSHMSRQDTRYIMDRLRDIMAQPSIILSMCYFYDIVDEWWHRVDPVYITWKPSVTGTDNVKCFDPN